jgi:nucleoside triphosphate diphosphatase
MTPSKNIADLLEIMRRLRTPGSGCPWDLEQSFRTIAPYAIEEAHEVVDAIERSDYDDLADELGDLLLQVVFHARMAEELNLFDFGDVVERITAKMIRRHPHVFARTSELGAKDVALAWSQIKAQEKADRARRRGETDAQAPAGFLDAGPSALPALSQAVKLQARASTVGFDWRDAVKVLDKIREETDEIEQALARGSHAEIEDEIGDLFFALANFARHLDIDPEQATRGSNRKFIRRFGHIEQSLAAGGRKLGDARLDEMDALWNEAKALEKKAADSSTSLRGATAKKHSRSHEN